MVLNKYVLGDFIEKSTENNKNLLYDFALIEGVCNEGSFTKPKIDTKYVDLKPYKIVKPGAFVYNPSRLDVGSIAYRTDGMCLVSHLYIVFYLNKKGKECIDPYYLYMYFRRKEFYREVRFRNFGSQRPEFNFEKMKEIELYLPSIEIQRKYVAVYKSLLENQKNYERGLDNLKLTCDSYIENLRKKHTSVPIGKYIVQNSENNSNLEYKDEDVVGVSKEHEMIPTKADTTNNDLSKFVLVQERDFIYNPRSANAICMNLSGKNRIISWNNTAFRLNKGDVLPEFLMMFFSRKEYERWAIYNSWGSSTEVLSFDELKKYCIPIPPVEKQQYIVNIYMAYINRKKIIEEIKEKSKNICSILIKGSLEEAKSN